MKRYWLLGSLALMAGCFAPRFNDGDFPCKTTSQCPSNYHCAVDNTCWKNGHDPIGSDMGVGMTDGAAADMVVGADLLPVSYPPASVWSSCGGGPVTAPSNNQLNVSIGNTPVMGISTAPSGAVVTFGYFTDDVY